MSIRFHLDEHIALAVANGLRRQGLDVTTSHEAGLVGHDDHEQLAFAIAEGRVLVTNDHHFTIPERHSPPHAGICYCHPDKYTTRQLLEVLVVVAECLSSEEMKDRLEYL